MSPLLLATLLLLGQVEPAPAPTRGAEVQPPLPAGERAGEGREDPPAPPWHLDLTVGDVGLGLGGSPHIDGLRLAYRDSAPSVVHGVSVTLWSPRKGGRVDVDGVALGLPIHAAGRLRGVALGVGVGADERLDGVAVGLLGAGAGKGLRGIVVGGLGAGAGEDLAGVVVGGLGAGAGGGGTGLVVGGLGAGAGGDFRGILAGGLGAGGGGDVRGLVVGGLGAGAGGDLTGLVAGGLGAGAGGTLRGVAVAGLGAGAPTVRGLLLAPLAGGRDVAGLVLAPLHFRVEHGGRFEGLALGAVNLVRGEQVGCTVGLFNYAETLHGVQVGLLNWAGNNPPGLRLLPLGNAHLD